MIAGVEARLKTVAEFKSVTIAHEMEEEAFEAMDLTAMPYILLYYGNTLYQPSESTMLIRHVTDKRLVALLFCETKDMDTLEEKAVAAVLGYKKAPSYTGMNAVNGATVHIEGPGQCRRIEFSTETRVSQTTM